MHFFTFAVRRLARVPLCILTVCQAPPVEDPRKDHPDYRKGHGPTVGKKRLRHALDRARWEWDQHYIGPGPPAQILITGLSTLATEHEVLMNFKQFGDIEKFELKMDPTTGGSLGVCTIIYRDNKTAKTLGHQAAKRATQKGNGLRIAMQQVKVVLDRDGLKCTKVVNRILEEKRKKQDELRRKQEEEESKHRENAAKNAPSERRDESQTIDQDNRFNKPRPANYKAIDDLGQRPAVWISSKHIPGGSRMVKHLYGRLRNFGVEEVLWDKDGYFVVFETLKGLNKCRMMCNGDRLFNFPMFMEAYRYGNPAERQQDAQKTQDLEKPDVLKMSVKGAYKDLLDSLVSDVRKRIADPFIFDLLEPERLKRRKVEEPSTGEVKDEEPAPTPVPVTLPEQPTTLQISHLPRFKKRAKPKRVEAPTSDATTPSKRGHARPLAHSLNQYDVAPSDDESITTDRRLLSPGSDSRALSTDIGDDDATSVAASFADLRNRKRKRSPSRLKDAALDTDDEEADEPESAERTREGSHMDVDEENVAAGVNPFAEETDEDVTARRKKPRKSSFVEEPEAAKDEDVDVDIMGLDDDQDKSLVKAEEIEDLAPVIIDTTWLESTTDYPRPSVEDDMDMILDLDGIQACVLDSEDFQFLRAAIKEKDIKPAPIGNAYMWACKAKEVKASNHDGKRGVIHALEKIEGFYRPNPSGCARTEGYRKIPEAEKSMYLPHRLAVAAKRANAANQTTSTAPSKTTATKTNKPLSSSRENRVNNRRLVQELNNQKQILSGDADVMRFNQLKKRKKPVRFARSAIHNWGLYAMENIAANDMIIEYVGEIVRQQVADMRERKYIKSGIGSSYLFRIDENTVIDATKKGGIARFINHSCTPNCTAKIIKVEGSKRIVIYAMRDISESRFPHSIFYEINN